MLLYNNINCLLIIYCDIYKNSNYGRLFIEKPHLYSIISMILLKSFYIKIR